MALRLSVPLMMMMSSFKLSQGASAMQRPGWSSSPNEINNQIYDTNGSKIMDKKYNIEKTIYQNSRTNVEKPNTDDYKLLEIELRDGGERRRKTVKEEARERETEDEEEEKKGGGYGPREINFGKIIREVFGEDSSIEKKEENEKEKLSSKDSKIDFDKYSSKNDKFYYLKPGKTDPIRKRTSWEPRSYIKSILIKGDNYSNEKYKATKSFQRPKKYRVNNYENLDKYEVYEKNYPEGKKKYDRYIFARNYKNYESYTTENSLPTSSELPKQIPPPPSRVPSQNIFSNTTPVLKFMSKRTDILPNGYAI